MRGVRYDGIRELQSPSAVPECLDALTTGTAPIRMAAIHRKEIEMTYFVTGATGFIGRYLVANLLRRERPIYVLVRKGSEKKLAAMRKRWGADEKQVIGIEGDLAKPKLGVSAADLKKLKGKVDHLFHLAAIYDLKASAEEQEIANVEGVGEVRAKEIREGLRRLQEINLVDRYLQT